MTRCACLLLLAVAASSARSGDAKSRSTCDSLTLRVQELSADGLFREAVRVTEMIPSDSLTGRGCAIAAAAYAGVGDYQKSLRVLKRAVALDPGAAGYRYQLARQLAAGGEIRDAIAQYEVLTRGDSAFFPALTSYGALLVEEGDVAAAAPLFARTLSSTPRDFLANYYYGRCLTGMGGSDSAKTFLAASVSLNPSYAPAIELLGSLHFENGRYDEALRLYDKLCGLRPRDPDHWYKAGLCEEKLEQHRLAIDYFRRAAALDTSEVMYRAHLGQLFFAIGLLDSSIVEYRNAIGLDATNPVLYLNLGLCLARLDSTDAAVTAFRRGSSAQQPEKLALLYNQWGAVLYNKKRYREARTAYAAALRFDPANADANFFLAAANEQTGRPGAAVTHYRRFLSLTGHEPRASEKREHARQRIAAHAGKK